MAANVFPDGIEYCPICGLPPEFCEFGPKFKQCQPWLIENHPELYPALVAAAAEAAANAETEGTDAPKKKRKKKKKKKVEEDDDGEGEEDGVDEEGELAKKAEDLALDGEEGEGEGGEEAPKKKRKKKVKIQKAVEEGDVLLPGGKIKKKEERIVTVTLSTRNKRKFITSISGLDKFDIKLKDASKKFGKRFATGASITKGERGGDAIAIQGDLGDDVIDFIQETWDQIPDECVVFVDGTKKKSGA